MTTRPYQSESHVSRQHRAQKSPSAEELEQMSYRTDPCWRHSWSNEACESEPGCVYSEEPTGLYACNNPTWAPGRPPTATAEKYQRRLTSNAPRARKYEEEKAERSPTAEEAKQIYEMIAHNEACEEREFLSRQHCEELYTSLDREPERVQKALLRGYLGYPAPEGYTWPLQIQGSETRRRREETKEEEEEEQLENEPEEQFRGSPTTRFYY